MRGLTAALLMLPALASGCADSSSCAEGFVEEGGNCVPRCLEECGAHERCMANTDGAQCECVAGYEGEPCAWAGGLRDPEFKDPSAWSASSGGATVLPLATGSGEEGGVASFDGSVVCNAGAVAQVVQMPSYDAAEPFAIEITYRASGVTGVAVGYNRAFKELASTSNRWSTARFCLGEAGYGGPVKFQISASERVANCFSDPFGSIEVDRMQIVPALEGECPAPGTVLNGVADLDEGGWSFQTESNAGDGLALASLVPDLGEDGSSGARIYKPAGVRNEASMRTKVSVPLPSTVPSPALRFWWRSSGPWSHSVDLGTYRSIGSESRPLDSLFGDGSASTSTYCLPPWTHGNVMELSFVTGGGFFADEADLVVDNVEIISDPKCGSAIDLLDPSFDSAPNRWPGVRVRFSEAPGSDVRVLRASGRARPPGSGVLEMVYTNNQAWLDAYFWVWVPPVDEKGGPLLTFHSDVPEDPGLFVRWVYGPGQPPTCADKLCPNNPLEADLPSGGGWRRNQVCLPPQWAERWLEFRIRIRPSEEPFRVFDPVVPVLLDDFSVRSDESCPTL